MSGRHPRIGAATIAAVAVAVVPIAGCSEHTAILLEVTSDDLVIPDDVDGLRFEVGSTSGRMVDRTFDLQGTWPQSLAVRPADDGDLGARLTVRVSGLKDGDTVIRRVLHDVRFREGTTHVVEVALSRSCLGVTCAPDVDCVSGMCVGAPVDAGPTDAGGADGGADAGSDAGMDAGRGDGSTEDAGSDAGPDDAGSDAGCVPTGAETCNSMDDDCDRNVDEGLPCPGALVLSEVTTGGPTGASDEFVEIYNRTAFAIDLTAVGIEYRSSSGASYTRRATAPAGASIPAHGYYLFGSEGYSRATTPDAPMAWSTGLAGSAGHVRIVDSTDAELDRLGWGSAVAPEGSAQPTLSDDRAQSYERKAVMTSSAASMMAGGADEDRGNGWDSDDNAVDFVHRTGPEPQSTASPTETP